MKVESGQLEVNVVDHCNLRCRGCSHVSPALPPMLVDPEDVYRDLAILAHHYHTVDLKLLGGEPLLHPRLVDVIDAGRRSGVADRIVVITNGVLLPRMPEEFWRRVDHVWVTVYPGKELSDDDQATCRARADHHGTGIGFTPVDSFRNSYTEIGTDDRRLVEQIFESCRVVHDWRCHTVADGRFFKCPQSLALPKLIDACAGNDTLDSVAIEDTPGFGDRLLAFLNDTRPLATCGYCLGTAGTRFAHEQVRRVEFRDLQRQPAEALVDPAALTPIAGAGDSPQASRGSTASASMP